VFTDSNNNLNEYICEIQHFLVFKIRNSFFFLAKVKYLEPDKLPKFASKVRGAYAYKKDTYSEVSDQDIIPVHMLLRRVLVTDSVAVILPSKLRS
jgi:hypothetical protein